VSDQQPDLYDYDGFLIPRNLSAERLSALNVLAMEQPALINLYPSGGFRIQASRQRLRPVDRSLAETDCGGDR
jgi:hypothetical protein